MVSTFLVFLFFLRRATLGGVWERGETVVRTSMVVVAIGMAVEKEEEEERGERGLSARGGRKDGGVSTPIQEVAAV